MESREGSQEGQDMEEEHSRVARRWTRRVRTGRRDIAGIGGTLGGPSGAGAPLPRSYQLAGRAATIMSVTAAGQNRVLVDSVWWP